MIDKVELAERVKLGEAWLDQHYPGWYKAIDLGTLELSSCNLCVLGQVWSGYIPPEERNQLVAQIVSKPVYSYLADDPARQLRMASGADGFEAMIRVHSAGFQMGVLGFTLRGEDIDDSDYTSLFSPSEKVFATLTDLWTEVIIQRRMADHPDVVEEASRLCRIERELSPA